MPIAAIIEAMQLAAQLEPTIAGLVPLIQKALSGTDFNDADLDALAQTKAALDAAVAAKVAAMGTADPSP